MKGVLFCLTNLRARRRNRSCGSIRRSFVRCSSDSIRRAFGESPRLNALVLPKQPSGNQPGRRRHRRALICRAYTKIYPGYDPRGGPHRSDRFYRFLKTAFFLIRLPLKIPVHGTCPNFEEHPFLGGDRYFLACVARASLINLIIVSLGTAPGTRRCPITKAGVPETPRASASP